VGIAAIRVFRSRSRIEIDDSPEFATYKVFRSGDMACPCGRAPLEMPNFTGVGVDGRHRSRVGVAAERPAAQADVDDMRRFPLHVVTPQDLAFHGINTEKLGRLLGRDPHTPGRFIERNTVRPAKLPEIDHRGPALRRNVDH